MNANMANLRWRCVDLTSLAIAFSKRDPLVEMGFQRVCTTIEIIIIITLFGATSRIEDDGLGSLRTEHGAVALSVGLQSPGARRR